MRIPLVVIFSAASLWGACKQYDFVVYGGTAAGVAAAVSASRNGLHTVLVTPGRHLGGMVSGGLSHSDIGNPNVIGGISREFFERVGKHYGTPVQWNFEPHAAEEVFKDMLQEAHVDVFYEHEIQEHGGVEIKDGRIQSIRTGNDAAFCGTTFADASYEGDLMEEAGVPYTWGRESTHDFGESTAGVRGKQRKDHHFNFPVSPYDSKGKLLPEVSSVPKGNLGDGDRKIQAYTYRMCLTDAPENRVPFAKPEGYKAGRYELLRREIDSLTTAHGHPPGIKELMIISPLPEHKYDINSFGGFSIDYIGGSWDYPTANYKRRAEIWKAHRDYEAGFFYFLANDPGVPDEVRKAVNSFGLAKDEFTDNQNWPYQLYVREGRRMIGEYVMKQPDIQEALTRPDSIGMGSYQSDSHHVTRVPTADGAVENEGEMYVPVHPYQIPYRVLLPKAGRTVNLLVPVCLSASHVAYSTLRMEPQYMILGQATGTAAALAKKSGKSIYDLDVAKLQSLLRSQHAVLEYAPTN